MASNDILHAFPGQLNDEPVFIFARQYPVAFIPTALIFIFLFALGLGGQFVLASGYFGLTADLVNAGIALLGVFQLFVLIVFYVAAMDFYFDLIVVTNRRLVDIDHEQLFFRRINELGLEEVEDVSSQQKGFFQTIFNYGTVEVETAGAKTNFVIDNIYLPREVTAIILNLSEQAKADVAVGKRFPQSPVAGVINNQPMTTVADLQAAGAAPADASL